MNKGVWAGGAQLGKTSKAGAAAVNMVAGQGWPLETPDPAHCYTPAGATYPGIAPTLTSLSATTLVLGSTYTATGMQFNGATQSSFFGDDFQNYTNYPLVRITNNSTHQVSYATSQNPSTMGVATGNQVTTTSFTVPATTTLGASTIVIVANGIPSNSITVTVEK